MGFAVRKGDRLEINENEKRDKYLDLARERISYRTSGDGNAMCDWCTWNGLKSLVRGLEELEIGRRRETIQSTA